MYINLPSQANKSKSHDIKEMFDEQIDGIFELISEQLERLRKIHPSQQVVSNLTQLLYNLYTWTKSHPISHISLFQEGLGPPNTSKSA